VQEAPVREVRVREVRVREVRVREVRVREDPARVQKAPAREAPVRAQVLVEVRVLEVRWRGFLPVRLRPVTAAQAECAITCGGWWPAHEFGPGRTYVGRHRKQSRHPQLARFRALMGMAALLGTVAAGTDILSAASSAAPPQSPSAMVISRSPVTAPPTVAQSSSAPPSSISPSSIPPGSGRGSVAGTPAPGVPATPAGGSAAPVPQASAPPSVPQASARTPWGASVAPGVASSAGVVASMARSVPVRVQIPAIGVDSALMGLGLQDDGTMQLPPTGFPAGWYTGAPSPGERGPAIIAGHVDWGGRPGVFYGLRDLVPGAEVTVARVDGSTAVFRVSRVQTFPKEAFPTAAVYGNLDHPGLRLITCGGSFDRAARSYVDNIVAFADLVGTRTP